MHRKIKDQAKRHNTTVPTMRGMLDNGLEFSQTEAGSIWISDEAMERYFTQRTKSKLGKSERAAELARKVV